MSKIKNALADLEDARDLLTYRRLALQTFKASTPYTRGGTYPKMVLSFKRDLAVSVIQLHKLLHSLGLTKVEPHSVVLSRRAIVHMREV